MDGDAATHHGDGEEGIPMYEESYIDVDTENEEDEAKLSAAELHYNKNGYAVKTVVAMAIGLPNDAGDGPLIDVMLPPWSTLAKKSTKLVAAELREEIIRRGPKDAPPRCGNWNLTRCRNWLVANPIKEAGDVAFICKIVQTTIDDSKAVAEEAIVPALAKITLPGQWRGNLPYLRLIMCLVEDDTIRHAYLHRGDALSRTQLDARYSTEVREPTVFEMLADKWNDPTFNPIVPVSDVHEDFRQPTDVSFNKASWLVCRYR
jgi:hypothetical protein